jgi:hypothetical protein
MFGSVDQLLVTEVAEGPIGPIFEGLQDGTNRASVLKYRQLTNKQRCLTSQKNEDVNYTLAETRNLADFMCILFLNLT